MSRTKKWTYNKKEDSNKWFTKHGPLGQDPAKMKKDGAGTANWGKIGDELQDEDELWNSRGSGRRNSNHDIHELNFKMANEKVENHLLASIDKEP